MARIQQVFGNNLPLAALFQGATVEQLAAIIQQQTDDSPWSSLVPIQPQDAAYQRGKQGVKSNVIFA
jgi:hypothetical protein